MGLAPNGQQDIIWTNEVPVYWRIYASLCPIALNQISLDY